MYRSTRLLILIKYIYTLYGRKRFLLRETYFSITIDDIFWVEVKRDIQNEDVEELKEINIFIFKFQ